MIKTILFATDLGLHTHYLIQHVNDMASQYNARIFVVHAIEPAGHFGDAVVQSYLSEETRQEFKEIGITRIVDGVKGRIVDMLEDEFVDGQHGLSNIQDVRVATGKPADVILEQASECKADLIILGSHGQDNHSQNMLGSVTTRILHMSRVPVYMVPLFRTLPTDFSHDTLQASLPLF